jgi:hypothetical protein
MLVKSTTAISRRRIWSTVSDDIPVLQDELHFGGRSVWTINRWFNTPHSTSVSRETHTTFADDDYCNTSSADSIGMFT